MLLNVKRKGQKPTFAITENWELKEEKKTRKKKISSVHFQGNNMQTKAKAAHHKCAINAFVILCRSSTLLYYMLWFLSAKKVV